MSEWLLLDGNRLVIVGWLFAGAVVAVAALQAAGLVPLQSAQPTFYLFGGLVSGNLTLITVVVSINQMVLSRELKAPGELEEQIEDIVNYRTRVEAAADGIAPVQPLGFFRVLLENTREESQRLGGLSFDGAPPEAAEEIEDVVSDLTEHVDRVDGYLQQSNPDTIQVLSAALTTNYAGKMGASASSGPTTGTTSRGRRCSR